MGYKPKSKIYRLRFEDPDYEGLEVRCRSPKMGSFFEMADLADIDVAAADLAEIAAVDRMFQIFADSVIDWNIEDNNDQPVPHTVAGLRSLDIDLVMSMVGAWMGAFQGMTPGLPQPSSGGQPSLEASLPMEDVSRSLRSLQEPA